MNIGDAAFSRADMMRRLHELEGIVRELVAGRRLENATVGEGGIRITDGGVIRSEDFNGSMAQADPGTSGWALGHDRLALLGAMVVPVDWFTDNDVVQEVAISTTPTDMASVTVPVPEWADNAAVTAMAMFSAENNGSTDGDLVRGQCVIDGEGGFGFTNDATFGESVQFNTHQMRILHLTERSSFNVAARMWTETDPWPAEPSNAVALSVLAVFRRTPHL